MHDNTLCDDVDCSNSKSGNGSNGSSSENFTFTVNHIDNNEITLEHLYAEPFVQKLLMAHVPLSLIAHYAYKYTQNYNNDNSTENNDDERDENETWYDHTK